jgi:hypothetical protein
MGAKDSRYSGRGELTETGLGTELRVDCNSS